MQMMSFSDAGYSRWVKQMDRVASPDPRVEETVAALLAEVKQGGDASLRKLTLRFDKVKLKAIRLDECPQTPPTSVVSALTCAKENIRRFSKGRMPKSWRMKNTEGAAVGENFFPFERVGIYVPGGSAPLVSTALMTVTLAAAAGCTEIAVVTPPPVDPVLHYAIMLAGATEVYALGGVQAVGALAFGTKSVKRVQKIFGPGNAFVTEAKRQVMGHVAIDQLPGPSEALIIADSEATPAFIAADMLAQAEHGAGSVAVLLTPSRKIRDAVKKEIDRQSAGLSRSSILARSLINAALVQTRSMEEAVEIANAFAPEHLSLQVANPKKWLPSIRSAGAVFLGGFSPVAAGDFVAGPSHTLPTGGAAKSFSGLTVDQFFRRTSVIEYSRRSLEKVRGTIAAFSEMEKLDAHGRSVHIRFEEVSRT